MAKARIQVESGIERKRIRPLASPVDTFKQTNAGQKLAQLASGLVSISPSISGLSDTLAKRAIASDVAEGEQAAREMFESGKSYRDAIKQGLITPDQSPWFRLGAKEQFGRNAAYKFRSDMLAEAQSALADSTDIADFDKFAGEFRGKWMGENIGESRDLHFEQGFGKLADTFVADLRNSFASQMGARLVQDVNDGHYAEVFNTINAELDRGTDVKGIAEALNLVNARAVAIGVKPKVANKALLAAVAQVALTRRDARLFDTLKSVKGGTSALFSTKDAQDLITETTGKIAVIRKTEELAERERRQEEEKQTVRKIYGSVTEKLLSASNPASLFIDDDIRKLSKLDPHAAQGLVQLRNTVAGQRFDTNPQAENDVLGDIWTITDPASSEYVTPRTLVNLMNARQINAETFRTLVAQINTRDEANDPVSGKNHPYNDPQFRDARAGLRQLFASDFTFDADRSARANRAQAEFIQEWLRFAEGEGKGANFKTKNEWIAEAQDRLRRKYQNASDRRSVKGLPDADLAVQTDWRKVKVLTRTDLARMEKDVADGLDSLSNETIERLQDLRVQPSDLPAFIAAQRQLHNR